MTFSKTGIRGVVSFAAMLCAIVLCASVFSAPAVKEGGVGNAGVPGSPPTPARATLAATVLYDNTGQAGTAYYTGQGGDEAIDDLHLVSGGSLDTLTFEYFDAVAAGPFTATVRIYENPGGLDGAISAVGGPYVVNGLASGRRTVSVPIAGLPIVGADIWAGVRFSSSTAGLIINSVASVGLSHDLYLENGDLFWFGGNPKANFGLRVVGQAQPLAVAWGREGSGVKLAPVRPNPVRTGATIGYTIARRGPVRLHVLDLAGRRVRTLVDESMEAGEHTVQWSGRDDAGRFVATGVYLVRLESDAAVSTRKLHVTR